MTTLIKNGYVIDPSTNTEGIYDIYIKDQTIEQVAPKIDLDAEQVIDASGLYVMPGFIDLHVHLREPGFEYKETIQTGSMAAAAGGYTPIVPMPYHKTASEKHQQGITFCGKTKRE